MKTEKIKEMTLSQIIDLFQKNNVVIMPTDTVYGIVSIATEENAKRIYQIKKRKENKPFIILMNSKEMISRYCEISELEAKLMEKYKEDALTIILKKKNNDTSLANEKDTIAIRIPNNELLLEIMNQIQKPLISTSANISGEKIISSIEEIPLSIWKNVDFVLDGGTCLNEASTLIQVKEEKIKIIRRGSCASLIEQDWPDFLE